MGKLTLLEYPVAPEVRAFSTTRKGGVSEGNYAEFNVTHYCGDDPEKVASNRALLCAELGIDDEKLILPRQVHGTNVRLVNADYFSLSPAAREMVLNEADAVITNERSVCIGVSTADCVPILLYDPEKGVAAAIHAGWRGTVAKIVHRTVEELRRQFDCDPTKMTAVLGPCISVDAFEVGDEVVEAFRQAGFDLDAIVRRYPTGRCHIDLLAANYQLLEDCGFGIDKVQVAGICTYGTSDSFFSARKLGIESGRIYTGIMMK